MYMGEESSPHDVRVTRSSRVKLAQTGKIKLFRFIKENPGVFPLRLALLRNKPFDVITEGGAYFNMIEDTGEDTPQGVPPNTNARAHAREQEETKEGRPDDQRIASDMYESGGTAHTSNTPHPPELEGAEINSDITHNGSQVLDFDDTRTPQRRYPRRERAPRIITDPTPQVSGPIANKYPQYQPGVEVETTEGSGRIIEALGGCKYLVDFHGEGTYQVSKRYGDNNERTNMWIKGAHPNWREGDGQDFTTLEANYAERAPHVHELNLARMNNASGLHASHLLCSNASPSKDKPIEHQPLGDRLHELMLAQTITKFGISTADDEKHAELWKQLEDAKDASAANAILVGKVKALVINKKLRSGYNARQVRALQMIVEHSANLRRYLMGTKQSGSCGFS